MTLFAAEPDVVDPVALTWDDQGRMYVVEMRDYPNGIGPRGTPGGTVRLLQDRDGDGQADSSVLFADGLSFPTSIAPWNGGVIVAAPPEILFLRDTNGDGKADQREVLLKGFELDVTDSNVNGLRWGLDNRLHGVNGGNGGSIVSVRTNGPAVPLSNCDFAFDPATGEFSLTYHTSGGFGLVFDEWGRSFVTYNINHIQQRLIPVRYLNRFPGFPPLAGVESISDHEVMSRIYPISEPETRPNHPEQSGHFSAAGGLGYIGWEGYPGDLFGSVLVCDVVGNLVHRDVLSRSTPAFIARRSLSETNREWFASRDASFRPVGIELGPDNALYLIDMQRDVIEHPDYIPQKVREKLDLRAGADRGRIYRLTPRGGLPARRVSLTSSRQLADALADANPWWRATAQRLLIERRDTNAIPLLKASARSQNPMQQLHALWALAGLQAMDEELVVGALRAPQPGLRENGLLLAERLLPGSPALHRSILALDKDDDARVRFQAALTLGQFEDSSTTNALLNILRRDYSHRWTRLATLSSLKTGETEVFLSLVEPAFLADGAEAKLDLVRELADLVGARSSGSNAFKLQRVLHHLSRAKEERWKLVALEGLQRGVARAGTRLTPGHQVSDELEQLAREGSNAIIGSCWKLSRSLGLPETAAQRELLARSITGATNNALPLAQRLEDIRLLALGSFDKSGPTLYGLLDASQPGEVQQAAVDALRDFQQPQVATHLVDRWRMLVPAVRAQVIQLLVQRTSFHTALVEAIESGRITLGELNLDLEQRRRLLRRSTPEVQARAARFIDDEEYGNRKNIVDEWLKKLPASGDAARGAVVFEKLCAQCHQLEGVGQAVGPDLGALAHRSVEDLASNILDPNMAINPAYVAYSVETATGELETGLLKSESSDAIELLQAQGRKLAIPRREIKSVQASGISLMPEGLEAGMTPVELRDLIAWLQRRR